ncbi:MAG: hypothetical protein JWN41_992, partial [Thermoleophilia bacterium]|nr:hypothetical protein [Thermoleophilia bacterium]
MLIRAYWFVAACTLSPWFRRTNAFLLIALVAGAGAADTKNKNDLALWLFALSLGSGIVEAIATWVIPRRVLIRDANAQLRS